jgi:sterol desaturase/sphingolipid hydroxylase (fatty acid hydroxylase superfamily)
MELPERKIRIPKIYIVVMIAILAIALFVGGTWLRIIPLGDVFLYTQNAVIYWIGLIFFAIVGAVFFGMLISHRLITTQNFTPFEKMVLEMRRELGEINTRLAQIEKHLLDNGKKR